MERVCILELVPADDIVVRVDNFNHPAGHIHVVVAMLLVSIKMRTRLALLLCW